VQEICTLRATGRGLETEPWHGLRHRRDAAASRRKPPETATPQCLPPPRQSSTLPGARGGSGRRASALADRLAASGGLTNESVLAGLVRTNGEVRLGSAAASLRRSRIVSERGRAYWA